MSEKSFALLRHDGQLFPFGGEGIRIGRSSTNQVVISDPSVSRSHARILVSGGQCWLRDENSAGGTYINDRRVQGQQVIQINDVVTIGNAAFRLIRSQTTRPRKKRSSSGGTTQKVDMQRLLPALIGGGVVLLLAVVAAFSRGLDPMSGLSYSSSPSSSLSSSSGVAVDPWQQAVADAEQALADHPDFEEHLGEYQEVADKVDDYLSFEEEAQDVIGMIDTLKAINIPLVGSAWEVIIKTASTTHPGSGEVIKVLDNILRDLLRFKGSMDNVIVVGDTRQASLTFQDQPSRETLVALEGTTASSISALEELQGELQPILDKSTEVMTKVELALDIIENVAGEIDVGAVHDFIDEIRAVLQPINDLNDYLSSLDRWIDQDVALMRSLQSITAQAR